MQTTGITLTLTNLSPAHLAGIHSLLNTDGEETTTTRKRKSKSAPEKTVSDDEDEDFGKKAMSDDELDEPEEEEEEESEEEEEEEEEEDSVKISFKDLKAAVNKYGEKHPDQMRAILMTYKIAGPKELAATKNEKHWDAIYAKVLSKMKATKKK